LPITPTDATLPINNGFKRISKTIKVPKHHPTKQAAVDTVNPGDIVLAYDRRYREHVVTDKTLTL
jgi:hypothetical protein